MFFSDDEGKRRPANDRGSATDRNSSFDAFIDGYPNYLGETNIQGELAQNNNVGGYNMAGRGHKGGRRRLQNENISSSIFLIRCNRENCFIILYIPTCRRRKRRSVDPGTVRPYPMTKYGDEYYILTEDVDSDDEQWLVIGQKLVACIKKAPPLTRREEFIKVGTRSLSRRCLMFHFQVLCYTATPHIYSDDALIGRAINLPNSVPSLHPALICISLYCTECNNFQAFVCN